MKLESIGYRVAFFEILSLSVLIRSRLVMDEQTDGRTREYRTGIASRG